MLYDQIALGSLYILLRKYNSLISFFFSLHATLNTSKDA